MLPVCVLGIVVSVDTGPAMYPSTAEESRQKSMAPTSPQWQKSPWARQRQKKLLMTQLICGRTMLCHPIVCNYQRTFWHRAVHNGDSLKEYPIMVSDVSLGQSVPLWIEGLPWINKKNLCWSVSWQGDSAFLTTHQPMFYIFILAKTQQADLSKNKTPGLQQWKLPWLSWLTFCTVGNAKHGIGDMHITA